MSDVSSVAPAEVTTWVAIDQHKLSLVAATLRAHGGQPEVVRVENTERAIRRFIERLGGPEGLAVAYEAGPGGYELHRLLGALGFSAKGTVDSDFAQRVLEEGELLIIELGDE